MPQTHFKKRRPSSFNKKRRSNPRRPKAQGIDVSKYINKAQAAAKRPAYEVRHQFADFMLDPDLLSRIEQKGFKAPAEIQDKAIPHILDGENLIGLAGTGTGKTAAFLIPIIQCLIEEKQDRYALIIAPTRELANQINDEFRSLTKGLGIYSTCLIGGKPVFESVKSLKRTNHLVIGTPGRLMDMHKQKHLFFDRFHTLVLDEFDRMLDMGFKDEMMEINQKMTSKQQTLLFSATADPTQRKLIESMAGNAVEVKAASSDAQKTSRIEQDVVRVKGQNKFQLLQDLLVDSSDEKIILFCETKREADGMAVKLKEKSVGADSIHGDKSQRDREKVLRKFKRGQVNVLVATDVVARGIDVSDVSLVINYKPPMNYTDYVHRIGRTGRAGKTGKAITFID